MKKLAGIFGVCLFSTTMSGMAQLVPLSSDIMRPIPGAGHDYIKGLNETVNPANGSLSISIQLPTLASRGITLPFSVIYNSGIVHHTAVQEYSGGTTAGLSIDGDGYIPTDRSVNGWSDSIPYVAVSSLQTTQSGSAYSVSCSISSSYTIYSPSGQSYPLGISAISPASGYGFADQNYCIDNSGWNGIESRDIYGYSAQLAGICDGSTSGDSTPGCGGAAPAFTVTDPDSTVYSFAANSYGNPADSTLSTFVFPTTIEDRNGNIVRISPGQQSNGNGGLTPTVVTDTSGRSAVQVNYNSSGAGPIQSYLVGGLSYGVSYTTTAASYTAQSERVNQTSITCSANFQVNDSSLPVIQSITLPNGQQYVFKYDSTYGLVNEIDYPDGGWVKYTWGLSRLGSFPYSDFVSAPGYNAGTSTPVVGGVCDYWYQSPAVLTREVGYTQGGPAVLTQQFQYTTTQGSEYYLWGSKTTTVKTTDNVTGETSETTYTYSSVNQVVSPTPPGGQLPVQIPVEQSVVTSQWGQGNNPSSSNVLTVNKTWNDPYEMATEQRITGSGRTVYQGTYSYGIDELLTRRQECDTSDSTGCRTTSFSYSVRSTPCQEIVYDGSLNRIAETDAYYDGSSTVCATGGAATGNGVSGLPTGTHDETNYGPSLGAMRGNITKLVRWLNGGSSPTTTYTYDETGHRVTATDACGNGSCSDVVGSTHTTSYSYTDSPSGGNPAGNSNAYLTLITHPSSYQEHFTYNYSTGNLLSAEDENGQFTYYTYSDPLNRLTKTTYPDEGVKSISYQDSVPSITTTTLVSSTASTTSTVTFDGMGHSIQTQNSDPDGTDYVDVTYDGEGHVYQKSNPTRCSSTPGTMPSSCSQDGGTWGIATFNYDPLGRTIQTKNADGSVEQSCYDGVQSYPTVSDCNSQVGGISGGTWVDSTDENGNHWQRTSDGFGRLLDVMEPNGTSQSPTMETDYYHDLLDNLTSVTQWGGPSGSSGARSRSFSYDTLSRLFQSFNSESGWTCYGSTNEAPPNGSNCSEGYDLNGNLSEKTDARGVQISYLYDEVDRPLSKTYSSNAPAGSLSSCFQYDTAANGLNRLGSDWTQSGTCPQSPPAAPGYQSLRVIGNYDAMGRITTEKQCVLGFCTSDSPPSPPSNNCNTLSTANGLSYCYDYSGDLTAYSNGLTSVKFPQNWMLFSQGFDQEGRLSSVSSSVNGSQLPPNLLTVEPSTGYTSFGALENWTFGGNLEVTKSYDTRLRVASKTATQQ